MAPSFMRSGGVCQSVRRGALHATPEPNPASACGVASNGRTTRVRELRMGGYKPLGDRGLEGHGTRLGRSAGGRAWL